MKRVVHFEMESELGMVGA